MSVSFYGCVLLERLDSDIVVDVVVRDCDEAVDVELLLRVVVDCELVDSVL